MKLVALMLMVLNQGKVQQQASLSVMKWHWEMLNKQGEALQQLLGESATDIQHAVQSHLGGNIDLKL